MVRHKSKLTLKSRSRSRSILKSKTRSKSKSKSQTKIKPLKHFEKLKMSLQKFYGKIKNPLKILGILLISGWLGQKSLNLLYNIKQENLIPKLVHILKKQNLKSEDINFLSDYCTEINMIYAVNYVLNNDMLNFNAWDNQFYNTYNWKVSIQNFIKLQRTIKTNYYQAAPDDPNSQKLLNKGLEKELVIISDMENRLKQVQDMKEFQNIKNSFGLAYIC